MSSTVETQSKLVRLNLFLLGANNVVHFSSVQSLSCVRLFATPWIAARQASLSITNSRSSLRLMSIESVMTSTHLILYRPLFLLPPIPPSIRVFSNESTLRMRWPKNWSFSLSISPSNEHPGLVSFGMEWLNLYILVGKNFKIIISKSKSFTQFMFVLFMKLKFKIKMASHSLSSIWPYMIKTDLKASPKIIENNILCT